MTDKPPKRRYGIGLISQRGMVPRPLWNPAHPKANVDNYLNPEAYTVNPTEFHTWGSDDRGICAEETEWVEIPEPRWRIAYCNPKTGAMFWRTGDSWTSDKKAARLFTDEDRKAFPKNNPAWKIKPDKAAADAAHFSGAADGFNGCYWEPEYPEPPKKRWRITFQGGVGGAVYWWRQDDGYSKFIWTNSEKSARIFTDEDKATFTADKANAAWKIKPDKAAADASISRSSYDASYWEEIPPETPTIGEPEPMPPNKPPAPNLEAIRRLARKKAADLKKDQRSGSKGEGLEDFQHRHYSAIAHLIATFTAIEPEGLEGADLTAAADYNAALRTKLAITFADAFAVKGAFDRERFLKACTAVVSEPRDTEPEEDEAA